MLIERAIRPVVQFTGPGTPSPMPRRLDRARPEDLSNRANSLCTVLSTRVGPFAMALSITVSASTSPAAVATARRPWVAPRSAASTVVSWSLSRSRVEGRPRPSTMLPSAIR